MVLSVILTALYIYLTILEIKEGQQGEGPQGEEAPQEAPQRRMISLFIVPRLLLLLVIPFIVHSLVLFTVRLIEYETHGLTQICLLSNKTHKNRRTDSIHTNYKPLGCC